MSAGEDATTAGPVVESVELHVAAGAEAAFEAAVAEVLGTLSVRVFMTRTRSAGTPSSRIATPRILV